MWERKVGVVAAQLLYYWLGGFWSKLLNVKFKFETRQFGALPAAVKQSRTEDDLDDSDRLSQLRLLRRSKRSAPGPGLRRSPPGDPPPASQRLSSMVPVLNQPVHLCGRKRAVQVDHFQ